MRLDDTITLMDLPDEMRHDAANYLRALRQVELHRSTSNRHDSTADELFRIIDHIRMNAKGGVV